MLNIELFLFCFEYYLNDKVIYFFFVQIQVQVLCYVLYRKKIVNMFICILYLIFLKL